MAKDYSQLSKEELLKIIEKIESRKKYGLIWDEEKVKEQFEKDAEGALPVLKEIKSKEIIDKNGGPVNILIEGDNYHALSVLNFTHQGKIDVIYIDPPYNTGGGDFKYNDRFINKEDSFRHSKWLSFMDKRLRLAKGILKDDGVMFISIDDNEQPQLSLLLSEIFGEDNVETMIWRKSGFGRDGKMKNTTTFRKDHEYIMICYKSDKKLNKIEEIPDFQNDYGNPDDDPRGPYKAGSISRREDASNPNHKNYYSVKSPSKKVFTRQFDLPKEEFDELNNDIVINKNGKKVSRIYWGINGDSVPSIKIFLNEERSITPYSILLNKGTTTEGTKEVSEILGKDCTELRPKPTRLIQTMIQLGSKVDNPIIVDFFAGTGTTGHAVLQYIQKTKNNSQFILCTNDENKICTNYCYPRIVKIMKTGYKGNDGIKTKPLGGNLKYFKTSFVKNSLAKDEMKIRLVNECTEMLCLRESNFNEIRSTSDYKIFKQNNNILAIYYPLERDALKELKKELDKLEGSKTLYCFTLDPLGLGESDFIGWNDVTLEPIPQKILEVYKQIYEY
ncbi:MAG: site-specific DNA-methyltransferase [Candidatus ainarchaeum sp.]|jgi:adenine-specific DNA-methyltransferase|nr:site-specific DNA-methyltransferase [Candidatus ainarchaeum sp.]